MKPYYEASGITIYHGDCRDILGDLSAEVCVTDPPYGIGLNTDYSRFRDSAKGVRGYGFLRRSHPPVVGDERPFDPTPLFEFPEVVVWGANNYVHSLPLGGSWLVWDKRADNGHAMLADAELAWWSEGRTVKLFDHCWHGFARASENSQHFHPTQKPVQLMQWCILLTRNPGVVADPYMGSGTTLVAAKNLGRRAIGIEIEEKYCEIAVRRLEQEVLDFGGVA